MGLRHTRRALFSPPLWGSVAALLAQVAPGGLLAKRRGCHDGNAALVSACTRVSSITAQTSSATQLLIRFWVVKREWCTALGVVYKYAQKLTQKLYAQKLTPKEWRCLHICHITYISSRLPCEQRARTPSVARSNGCPCSFEPSTAPRDTPQHPPPE